MRIARFVSEGRIYTGRLVEGGQAYVIEGDLLGGYWVSEVRKPVERLLAPLVPANILCIGLNYRAHAAESGSEIPTHPVLFMKGSNALNHPGEPIVLPRNSDRVDYEGELAIVIGGRPLKDVPKKEALGYVLGYTIGNDVSARDWQREKSLSGGQWCRGKSFDGFCPLGPWVVTADEIPDPNQLSIRTLLNGQVMQDSNTSDMIFDVPTLIESLSSTMTLAPGTVILTGTPPGVGFARKPPVYLKAGDTLRIEIGGIGALENPVK
jgi:2-keto-4-pentenoate hydratase/2-oxohepta-3-ene-1,7-dioic acid hydratase in catechol pathway